MSVRTAKQDGKRFELQVYHQLIKQYSKPQYEIEKDVHLKEVGITVDYLIKNENGIVLAVEAKGGDHPTRKDGGAKRTDNVKKAIASGALYKGMYPSSTFVAYFSFPPNENSDSETSISVALNKKYFDDVVYISPEPENNIEIFLNG